MPKSQKKYKVESKTITKNINKAVSNPASLKGKSLSEINQIMSAIQGTSDFQRLYNLLNSQEKQYVDLNLGNPEPGEPKLFKGKKPHFEKIPQLTPEQSRAAYGLLQQAIPSAFLPKNASPEQIQSAQTQGLPGLLRELEKPYESPLNNQLQSMFGHMANPVLQGLMNQGYRHNAQVLFPSQLAQQGSGTLEALLGGLAQQYAPQAADYGYDLAAEYLPKAYESVQGLPGQIGGGIMNMLSTLGNKFRPAQQPQQ